MSNRSELEARLLERICGSVRSHGFDVCSKKGRAAIRKTQNGRHALILAFIRHPGDCDVTASVAVRFDALEELIHQHETRGWPGDEKLREWARKGTYSLGKYLGMVEGLPTRWTIVGPDDVDSAVRGIADQFTAEGLPFFERYGDMRNALDALSRDDDEGKALDPFIDSRAKHALGLAFLLGDERLFWTLVETKTRIVGTRDTPETQSWLAFRDALVEEMKQRSP